MREKTPPMSEQVACEAQIEQRMYEISKFDGGIRFHHTVLRPDLNMTYGLHETKKRAEEELEQRIAKYEDPQNPSAIKWEEQAEIIELEKGEKYNPWEDTMKTKTHGENDGTHESERPTR